MGYRERGSEPTVEWFLSRVHVLKNGCWELIPVKDGHRRKKLLHRPVVKLNGKTVGMSRWVLETFSERRLGRKLACHS